MELFELLLGEGNMDSDTDLGIIYGWELEDVIGEFFFLRLFRVGEEVSASSGVKKGCIGLG